MMSEGVYLCYFTIYFKVWYMAACRLIIKHVLWTVACVVRVKKGIADKKNIFVNTIFK